MRWKVGRTCVVVRVRYSGSVVPAEDRAAMFWGAACSLINDHERHVMSDSPSFQGDLLKIRIRCRLFWVTLCGGLLSAIVLIPINYAAAKVVGLMWVILSIATWMSPMMSICPNCHKSFHGGSFPSGWRLGKCSSCGVSLDEMDNK